MIQIVDAAMASAAARAGVHLVCRAGCSPCCHGVFQISALDAERLREGLSGAAPETGLRIRGRIAAAKSRLGPFFPGDSATGVLGADEEQVELFEEWAHADACPVLDPETGTCDLYAHRPVLCRTFGPPIRNDHGDVSAGVAICELCFTQATPDEILAAEMDSSFRALEESTDAEYARSHPASGPTIIAYAFAG